MPWHPTVDDMLDLSVVGFLKFNLNIVKIMINVNEFNFCLNYSIHSSHKDLSAKRSLKSAFFSSFISITLLEILEMFSS